MNNSSQFDLYRYQILPIDRFFTGDMIDDVRTVDELISRKNDFFAEALNAVQGFKNGQTEAVWKKMYDDKSFTLARVAANRVIRRETREFTAEQLENWPSLLVAIWNAPEKQLVAVQRRPVAFKETKTVAGLVLNRVERLLEKRHLTIKWEPLFETQVFWDIVEQFQGRIQQISFELITPNMANISGSLPDDLKEFQKQTNSTSSTYSISAEKASALNIDRKNKTLNGLVEYSSNGGGDISVRLKNVRKQIRTSKTVKSVTVDDVQLQGSAEEVVQVLKELLD